VRQVQQIGHGRERLSSGQKQHPFARSETPIPSSRPALRQSTARSGSQGCRRVGGGIGVAGAQRLERDPERSEGDAQNLAETVR
jgi:hypothetical protein